MGRRALGNERALEEVDPRAAQAGSPIALTLFDLLADPTSTLCRLLRVSDLFCVRLTCKEAWRCIQHRPLTKLGVLRAATEERGFDHHVPLLRWCLHNGVFDLDTNVYHYQTVGETGDDDLVSELLEIVPKPAEVMEHLLSGAAQAGHHKLALQVWAELAKLPKCAYSRNSIMYNVALAGCVRTAAAIDDDPTAWVHSLVYALLKGHRPFVEWVLADVEPDADAQYIPNAAKSGSLELVKWLYAKGYTVGGDAMLNAADSGNVDLCKWVSDHGLAPTQRAMDYAVEKGHVEVLEWLSTQGCSCTTALLHHAVRSGGVPVVAWCLDHHPHPPDAGDLLALSCQNEQGSNVFEYLADQRGFQSSEPELYRAVSGHTSWRRRQFDAAILVKRYGMQLFFDYLYDAIEQEDLGRLRFALSQGVEVSATCYAALIGSADAALLNEVLLARKLGGSVPEVDRRIINEVLREFHRQPNAKKVLADHSIVV
jgi:hypothetical protein